MCLFASLWLACWSVLLSVSPSLFLSVCLSVPMCILPCVCLFVCLLACLSVCPSIPQPACLPACLSVWCCLSVFSLCLSVCMPTCLPAHPSVCLSVRPSVRPSVHLSVCPDDMLSTVCMESQVCLHHAWFAGAPNLYDPYPWHADSRLGLDWSHFTAGCSHSIHSRQACITPCGMPATVVTPIIIAITSAMILRIPEYPSMSLNM